MNNATFLGLGNHTSQASEDTLSVGDFFFVKGVAERRLTRFVASLALGQLETCQALVEEYEHQLEVLAHHSSQPAVTVDPSLTGFQATLAQFKARKAQEGESQEARWRIETINMLKALLPQLRSMLMSVEMRTLDVAEEDDCRSDVVSANGVLCSSDEPPSRRPLPFLSSHFRVAPTPTILCKESLPFALMLSHRRETSIVTSAHSDPVAMISLLTERSKVLPSNTTLATTSDPLRRLPVLLFVLVRNLLSVPNELWNVPDATADPSHTEKVVSGHEAVIRSLSNFVFDLDTLGVCDFQKFVVLLRYLCRLVASLRAGTVLDEDDEEIPDLSPEDRMRRWQRGGQTGGEFAVAERAFTGAHHVVFDHLSLLWHFTRQYVSHASYVAYFAQFGDLTADIPTHACKLAVRALAVYAGPPPPPDEDSYDMVAVPPVGWLCCPHFLRGDLPSFIRAVLQLHPQVRPYLEYFEASAFREAAQKSILPTTPTMSLTIEQLLGSKVDPFEMVRGRIHAAVLAADTGRPQLLLTTLKQLFEDPFLEPLKPFVAYELYSGVSTDLLGRLFHGPHGGTSNKPACLRIQDHELIVDFLTKDALGPLTSDAGRAGGNKGETDIHPCLPWFNELRCTWQLLSHFQGAVKQSPATEDTPALLERVLHTMLASNGGVLDALYLISSDASAIPQTKRAQLMSSIGAAIGQTLMVTYPEIDPSSKSAVSNSGMTSSPKGSVRIRSPRYDVNMATQLACLQGVGLLQAVLQQIDVDHTNTNKAPPAVDWSKLTRSFYQALRTTSTVASFHGVEKEARGSGDDESDLRGNPLAELTIEIVLTLATQRILLPELQNRQHLEEESGESSATESGGNADRALEKFCSVVSALEENLRECISHQVLTALRVIIFRARQLLRSVRQPSVGSQSILPQMLSTWRPSSLLEPVPLMSANSASTPPLRSPTSSNNAVASPEQLLKVAFSDSPFQLLKEAVVDRKNLRVAKDVMSNLFTRVVSAASKDGPGPSGAPLLLFTFVASRLQALSSGSVTLDDFVTYLDNLSDRLLEERPAWMTSLAGSVNTSTLPPALLSRADLWFHAPHESLELVSALAEGAAADGPNSTLEHDFFTMLACVSTAVGGDEGNPSTREFYRRLVDVSLQPGARYATLRSCMEHLRMAKQACGSTTTTGADFLQSVQSLMNAVKGDGAVADPARLWKPVHASSKPGLPPNYLIDIATRLHCLSEWLPCITASMESVDQPSSVALSVSETLRTAHEVLFAAACKGYFLQSDDALSKAEIISPTDVATTILHEYVVCSILAAPKIFGLQQRGSSCMSMSLTDEINVVRTLEKLLQDGQVVSPEVVPTAMLLVSCRPMDIIQTFHREPSSSGGDRLFVTPVANVAFASLARGHHNALALRILQRQLRRQVEGEDDSSSDEENATSVEEAKEVSNEFPQTLADFRSPSDPFAVFTLAASHDNQLRMLVGLLETATDGSSNSDRDLHLIFQSVNVTLLAEGISALLKKATASSGAPDRVAERILWAVLTLSNEPLGPQRRRASNATDSTTTSLRGSFRGRRSRSDSTHASMHQDIVFAKNKPQVVSAAVVETLMANLSELCVRCNYLVPTSKGNCASYFNFVRAVNPSTHLACLERTEVELRLRIFDVWGAATSPIGARTFGAALNATAESKDISLEEMLAAVVQAKYVVGQHHAFVAKVSAHNSTADGLPVIENIVLNGCLPFCDLETSSLVNVCEQVVGHFGGVAGSAGLLSSEPGEDVDREEEGTMELLRGSPHSGRAALEIVFDMLLLVRGMFPAVLLCGGGGSAPQSTVDEAANNNKVPTKDDPSMARWAEGLGALLRQAALVGAGIQLRIARLDIPHLFCGANNVGRQRLNQYRSAALNGVSHDKLNQRRELRLIQSINAIATREFTIHVPTLTGGKGSKPTLTLAPLITLMSVGGGEQDAQEDGTQQPQEAGNSKSTAALIATAPFTTITQEFIGTLVTLVDLSLEAQHRAIRYVMSSKELCPLFGGPILGKPQPPSTRWHKILQGLDMMIRLLERERQEALLLAAVVKESGKSNVVLDGDGGENVDGSSSEEEETDGEGGALDDTSKIDAVFGRVFTAKPLLLVENLLMCQRVADVAAILPLVQTGREKECDKLLLKYAHFAVDISRYDDLPADEFPHGKTAEPKANLEPPLRPPPLKRWIAANATPAKIREIRSKFSYSNTPNMSLYKQMVRLCSDKDAAMESSLKFAERLFDSLAEYDAASKVIVIDTAEHVLMSLEPPSPRQTRLMRMFQVSRHLVLCKWDEHPPKSDLEDNASVMDLIRRLLGKGHMKAAFAIAEVCGLDISGVQELWMDRVTQLLDLGMYVEAGDAFSHLRGSYLEDALGYLRNAVEGAPVTSGFRATKGTAGQYTVKNVPEKEVPALLTQKRNGITSLLRRFGTRIDLLGFYVRVGDLGAATAIALDSCKEHKAEVITLYLQPMVERGSTEVLRAVIKDRDPTLAAMRPLIDVCCSHLDKVRNLKELYDWQRWMHDYALSAHTATLLSQTESKFETKLEYLKQADVFLVDAKLQPTMKLPNPPFAEDGVELPLLTTRMDHQKIQLALILCRLQQELICLLHNNGEDCNKLSVYGDMDAVTRMCVDLIILGKPFIEMTAKVAETLVLDAATICSGAVGILVSDRRYDVVDALVEYYSKKVTGVPTLQKNFIFYEIFKACAHDGGLANGGGGGNKRSAKIANQVLACMTAEGGRRVMALLTIEKYTQACQEAIESATFKSVESVYETCVKITPRTSEIEDIVNQTRHWLSRNKH